jgi:LmbE family N-acetylglucosaminyl deacetylase
MKESEITRRKFLGASAALAAALPLTALAAEGPGDRKLKVICVGGHPDDPESGCAGTLARYAQEGHIASVVYLTRGERGISGKSLDEAATIRTAECEAACKIMGTRTLFFGQTDGATEVTRAHVDAMSKLLTDQSPDVLFTHWPVDTHMDHQVASFLTIRAWMALRERPQLYFFEVNTGSQSEGFRPDTYVDISSVVEKKKAALLAHTSQHGDAIWKEHHEIIATWRGREAGVRAAEAFFHLNRGARNLHLPGI